MRVGYISFRIAGTDGVSLEAERWREILVGRGHSVTLIAGDLDRKGILEPDLHFFTPDVYRIHEQVVNNHVSYAVMERKVFEIAGRIEGELRKMFRVHKFDKLIVANVFSLPIHFPLAVALGRVVQDLRLPTVSRNHDFWWERDKYLNSGCFDFFKRFFPPLDVGMQHVTINSLAADEFKRRTGLDSVVIGDCFDFNSGWAKRDQFNEHFREEMGIGAEERVFLQATRIVPRKQIELAIELVARLGDDKNVLVMAGYDGDESGDYEEKLRRLAEQKGVRAMFIGDRVGAKRMVEGKKGRVYTLWDCFVNCDWVTYPSGFEGFGNQFIEAVYFKKPIFVNRYSVYKADLEPLGFETVAIDGKVTDRTIKQVKEWMNNPQQVAEAVQRNWEIGRDNFSYEATEKKLEKLGF